MTLSANDKRRQTLALKRTWIAAIDAAYPELPYRITSDKGMLCVEWIDGPMPDAMARLLDVNRTWAWHQLRRRLSPAAIARRNLESKWQHKLLRRKKRDLAIQRGVERRLALAPHFARLARMAALAARQLTLALA